jgi:hypothetical protein
VKFAGRNLPIAANLRALASFMEVQDAQVPPTGTNRGTPWAWMTTRQVGGEAVYGQGGPVTHGSQVVGQAAPGGVLVRLSAKPGTSCRGPPRTTIVRRHCGYSPPTPAGSIASPIWRLPTPDAALLLGRLRWHPSKAAFVSPAAAACCCASMHLRAILSLV